MALKPQKFCEIGSLQFDKKANTCYGVLQGYPVFVKILPRRDSVVLTLAAKAPENMDEAQIMNALTGYVQTKTGISAPEYRNRCIRAIISLTPHDAESTLAMRIAELVQFAADNSLTPCCMMCGAETGYRSYVFDEDGMTVCASCMPRIEEKMIEMRTEKAQVQANYGGIVLGALLGAAAVFVLTYFVLKLSYLSALTGFAGIMLGLFLMRKFGKKITMPAAIICALLCLAASVSAVFVNLSEEIADYNTENYAKASEICTGYKELEELIGKLSSEELAQLEKITGEKYDMAEYHENYEIAKFIMDHGTTSKCLQDFNELLSMDIYSDIKLELVKCILFSLLSIIAGVAVMAPSMVKEDAGVHTLRELPQ